MLFDLRSRGRRRTVQVVYLSLAVLIGAGLILFGVGTGSGGGGLFGAFTGSGSTNNNNNAAVTNAVKAAEKRTKTDPKSPAAWSSLLTARYSAANSGYNSTTGTYSAAGKTQLRYATQAYAQYAKLTSKPGADPATLAAHAYGQLDQYAQAASTWQAVVASTPGSLKGLECTALMSYAAGNTRVAQLAQAATLKKVPKKQRKTVATQLASAQKNKTIAVESC